MTRRVVLFDLDGTLTDPGEGILNSVTHALGKLEFPIPGIDRLRGFVGPPLHESFASLGLSQAEVVKAIDAYREYFTDRGLYENHVYAGVPEVLEALHRDDCVLGVATSKPGVFASRILHHFDLAEHFSMVIGEPPWVW